MGQGRGLGSYVQAIVLGSFQCRGVLQKGNCISFFSRLSVLFSFSLSLGDSPTEILFERPVKPNSTNQSPSTCMVFIASIPLNKAMRRDSKRSSFVSYDMRLFVLLFLVHTDSQNNGFKLILPQ